MQTKESLEREEKRQLRRITRAIDEAEKDIATLDEKIALCEEELANPDHADDHVKLMEIQAAIDALQEEHDAIAENWLELQEQLESNAK